MNVARMNFSHGEHSGHMEVYQRIRSIDDRVAIMQDLQGPKIRTGIIKDGGMMLDSGEKITLAAGKTGASGKVIPVTYSRLPDDVQPGNVIFLNDGQIQLEVLEVAGSDVICRVIHGGLMTSKKGVNLPGVRVSSPALTDKDREDLEFGLGMGVDYVALSFVRTGDEVRELKHLIELAGSGARVIAKIEKREALEAIDDILDETCAVMIARGDLGVEIPAEEVPVVQKTLIEACLAKGKPVITATQMLESMVNSKRPTRAEASDVANAVIDGTDAVMLSAETAVGNFPVEAVTVMSLIAEAAEKYKSNSFVGRKEADASFFDKADALTDALASGVAAVSKDIGASAIAVLTHSGQTARLIARRRPGIPIIALTDSKSVARQMSLVWGVEAITVESIEETETIFASVKEKVGKAGFEGKIVMTAGIPTKERRPSNTIHVIEI